MPLNCIAPKPEYGSSNPMEGLSEMSEPQDKSSIAFPGQPKSQPAVFQLSLYSITLKVSLTAICLNLLPKT